MITIDRSWNKDYTEQVLQIAAESYNGGLYAQDRPQELDEPVEVKDGKEAVMVSGEHPLPDDDEIVMGPAVVFYDEDGEEIDRLGWGDFGQAPVPNNINECCLHGCDRKDWWWELRQGICSTCLDGYTFSYVGSFGIIIPQDTGVYWRQQTQGVMCAQKHVEGVFIPLQEPTEYDREEREHIDLLSELRDANYQHDGERREELWDRIREALRWDFEWVDPPNDTYPRNQEALRWIEITDSNASYFHSTPNEDMEGKPVALVYPNCD